MPVAPDGCGELKSWDWTVPVPSTARTITSSSPVASGGIGIVVQLKRRGQCSVRGARTAWPFLLRVALVTFGVYCAVYAATKAIAAWGS
jgi:hypothetical protein